MRQLRRFRLLWIPAALSVAFLNRWMWDDDRLIAGVPVNLAYHTGLCVATTLLMWALMSPARLSDEDGDEE